MQVENGTGDTSEPVLEKKKAQAGVSLFKGDVFLDIWDGNKLGQ